MTKTVDQQMDEVIAAMDRETTAALECGEYEAGRFSLSKRQKQLYALMCQKFGPEWEARTTPPR